MKEEIIISKHAKERIKRYNLTEELVKTAIIQHDEIVEGYEGTSIAHKLFSKHILRVVYIKQDNKVKVITVYPAEKARYWRENEGIL